MSYRLPRRALGQVRYSVPRTGIGGSGITWEMVGIGAAVVGLFGAMVAMHQLHERAWEAAIPDKDERQGWRTALAAHSFVSALRD